ncbi:hypothetical protein FOZ62_007338, partial [Perkinsus olseni]
MASSSSLGPYVGETPNGEAPEMLECLPDDTIDCKYCGSIVEADYWSAHLRAPHHREKVGRQYRARQWETVRAYPDGQFSLESNYIEVSRASPSHTLNYPCTQLLFSLWLLPLKCINRVTINATNPS